MKNTNQHRKYGELPTIVATDLELVASEMMFYQYLPIKMQGYYGVKREPRLNFITPLLDICFEDFMDNYGFEDFKKCYVYVTVKYLYQITGCSFNRFGWHSDGFMTDDVNYIWSDQQPTVFNTSNFSLSQDDEKSLVEMNQQALSINNITFENRTLLRLDQYNIHKVSDEPFNGMRTFVKVSFSPDKYDLEGNSHNHLIDYNWPMQKRSASRNIPQSEVSVLPKKNS